MVLDLVRTVLQLIAIPSVNPMGRDTIDEPFLENRLTDHLERVCREMGLRVVRQPVAPGRENLIARLDGDTSAGQGGVVLFDAHQDTVPVEGMTIPPFEPTVRNGRIWGRGACDIKGGMAAMLVALSRLATERRPGMPSVVMTFTVNEENGFTGVREAVRLWQDQPHPLVPRRPDVAIVAEPTGLNVVVAHKGVVRWRCSTRGRAAHSSAPQNGENAIYRMGRVLGLLERYAREEVGQIASHPLCGSSTLSVGMIHGGLSVNTVPESCTIEIDRRLPPGERPDDARQRVIDYLAGDAGLDFDVEHDLPYCQGPPLSDVDNGAWAERLQRIAGEVTGSCHRLGAPFGTNAATFSEAGVPAVVCGPGFIEQAHTHDEWLPLDQLRQAVEVYYRFVRELAGC